MQRMTTGRGDWQTFYICILNFAASAMLSAVYSLMRSPVMGGSAMKIRFAINTRTYIIMIAIEVCSSSCEIVKH